MSRFNSKGDNFWKRGQTWDHFWFDAVDVPVIPSDSKLKIYTGSWVDKPLKAFIGGSWQTKPLTKI